MHALKIFQAIPHKNHQALDKYWEVRGDQNVTARQESEGYPHQMPILI